VLDRERAVDRTHTHGGQRMQSVDAEDDLLERAARDRPHDHDVARVERDVARAHREAAVDPADHPRDGGEHALVTAGAERALQPLAVPAAGRADDGDTHARTILSRADQPVTELSFGRVSSSDDLHPPDGRAGRSLSRDAQPI
jgi:hypothetical protein